MRFLLSLNDFKTDNFLVFISYINQDCDIWPRVMFGHRRQALKRAVKKILNSNIVYVIELYDYSDILIPDQLFTACRTLPRTEVSLRLLSKKRQQACYRTKRPRRRNKVRLLLRNPTNALALN